MNSDIVFEQDGTLYLDTAMSQSTFAKSRFTERLTENGMIAQNTEGEWKFTKWYFTNTLVKTVDDDNLNAAARNAAQTVLLEEKAFSGTTLKKLFDEETNGEKEKALCAKACGAVCAAIEAALEKNVYVSVNGAGGIFLNEDFSEIIFLPESIFEDAVICKGEEIYSNENGFYVCRDLTGSSAMQFTLAAIAYRMITGEVPFPEISSYKRHEDYLDHNFLKLSERIFGINGQVSFFIDNALMRQAKVETHKKASLLDKRSVNEKITASIKDDSKNEVNGNADKKILRAGLSFPLNQFYEETGLDSKGNIPESGRLNAREEPDASALQKFKRENQKAQEGFQNALRTRRWFRHNRTLLSVISGVCVVLIFVAATIINDKKSNPTTIGLTSAQTIEMFYSSFNNLDVNSIQQCFKGKDGEKVSDLTSNFYVTTKSRAAYDASLKCVTPAAWFLYNNKGTFSMFGLTQFTIDGVQGNLCFNGPVRNTNPKPLESENGIVLENGTTVNHSVHYNLVFNEGAEILNVYEHNDIVTLTWAKNRWIVTGIQENFTEEIVNFTEVTQKYNSAMEDTADNGQVAVTFLQDDYKWLSTKAEIKGARDKIESESLF